MKFSNKNMKVITISLFVTLILLSVYICKNKIKENIINYSPDVFAEINNMRENDKTGNCVKTHTKPKPWEKQFCPKNVNPCYKSNSPTPPFPEKDIGSPGCVTPYSSTCQNKANDEKEGFLDWSLYNPPISNGFTPSWFPQMGQAYLSPEIAYKTSLDRIYNPLRYPYRTQAFYEQGWFPNMVLPPQVIGCGGRRGGCVGGSEVVIPTTPSMIEISERNIAPVNVMTRGPLGIPQQVGVLYKIFGSLNDVYPLYGRKRYPNSDTWDYYTLIGQEGNRVKAKVLTKRKNNNELLTNDVVQIDGNTAKFRVTVYQSDFPMYVPYV